jgi:phospholipase C
MQIFLDSKLVYQVAANSINTDIFSATGSHKITVQAKDSAGAIFSKSVLINVNPGGMANIRHIIFFVQENRSVDDYLGRFPAYQQMQGASPNFDGVPLNASLPDYSGTANVSPFHYKTECTDNLSPSWNESHYDVDGGKMDRFMQTTHSVPSTYDPQGTRAMGYYDWSDLPFYYDAAYKFGTTDRMFSPVLANTIPNRMYLFAATSFGHIASDSPPTGGWPVKTIFDALRLSHISWRYYYQDNSIFLAQWAGWSQDSSNVVNISHWYSDVQNESSLPSVIFIERASQTGLDEHPLNNVQKGAADVQKILTALLDQPATWASSVFIITYDEGGGLYDHVPPVTLPKPDNIPPMLKSGDLPGNFSTSGFRVPFMLLSPYSKPHFVSHMVRDTTSILKLIETRFNVVPLTQRDAKADDLTEFFNFSSPFWLTPPALQTQLAGGACSPSMEKAPGF